MGWCRGVHARHGRRHAKRKEAPARRPVKGRQAGAWWGVCVYRALCICSPSAVSKRKNAPARRPAKGLGVGDVGGGGGGGVVVVQVVQVVRVDVHGGYTWSLSALYSERESIATATHIVRHKIHHMSSCKKWYRARPYLQQFWLLW